MRGYELTQGGGVRTVLLDDNEGTFYSLHTSFTRRYKDVGLFRFQGTNGTDHGQLHTRPVETYMDGKQDHYFRVVTTTGDERVVTIYGDFARTGGVYFGSMVVVQAYGVGSRTYTRVIGSGRRSILITRFAGYLPVVLNNAFVVLGITIVVELDGGTNGVTTTYIVDLLGYVGVGPERGGVIYGLFKGGA